MISLLHMIIIRYLNDNPIVVIGSPNMNFLQSLSDITLDWDSFQCRPEAPSDGWSTFYIAEPIVVQNLPNCSWVHYSNKYETITSTRTQIITSSSTTTDTTTTTTTAATAAALLPNICVWYAAHMRTCDSTTIRFDSS